MKKIYTLANMAKGMMLAALLAVGQLLLRRMFQVTQKTVLLKAMKMVATRMKLSLLLLKVLGSNL